MYEKVEWFQIEASSARFFRIGENVHAGQILGEFPDGWGYVVTIEDGKIIQIQYDIDNNLVILAISPTLVALIAA